MSRLLTSHPRRNLNGQPTPADPLDELPPDFSRKVIRHLKSLDREHWGAWPLLYRDFPNDAEGRLLFIDRLLRHALAPGGGRPFDLNRYRGWLLTQVIDQLPGCRALRGTRSDFGYLLPDELRTLVEHLEFFRRNRARFSPQQRCIQRLTPAELRAAVGKKISPGAIDKEALAAAHATFIACDGGNGHALRIARNENGSELIMPLTEPASRAFGSPQWCTAYRAADKSHFGSYFRLGPLVIAIGSEGEREQLHPATGEFRDACNTPISLVGHAFCHLLADQQALFNAALQALQQSPSCEMSVALGAIRALMKLYRSSHANTERALALFLKIVRENGYILYEHDSKGYALLHHLVEERQTELVRALLTLPEADVNQPTAKGGTALHMAVNARHTKMVELLLQHPGIDVNAKTKASMTPLHVAVESAPDIAKLLLAKSGTDVNAKDRHGITPLAYAVARQKEDIALVLLKAPGLDLAKHVGPHGNTVLHLAASCPAAALLQTMAKLPGINAKASNRKGQTPLHLAALHGDIATIECLVRLCPQSRAKKDRQGRTPFDCAAHHTTDIELRNALLLPQRRTMH